MRLITPSRNLIYSKKYFWFGTDAVDPKTAPALLKDHHLASWVSETGKGLLFFNEKGTDKKNPTGAVHLVCRRDALPILGRQQTNARYHSRLMLPSPPPRATTSSS